MIQGRNEGRLMKRLKLKDWQLLSHGGWASIIKLVAVPGVICG
jgi:hypothetical protein